ncbi:MAG: hypothetical protein V3S93_06435 [Methyloceanibacter sp.]|jgi:hypothetical protein
MPDYGEILAFLAANPPQVENDRELHASLLEMLAKCLRTQQVITDEDGEDSLDLSEIRWGSVN